jgi:gas vesicle protein
MSFIFRISAFQRGYLVGAVVGVVVAFLLRASAGESICL